MAPGRPFLINTIGIEVLRPRVHPENMTWERIAVFVEKLRDVQQSDGICAAYHVTKLLNFKYCFGLCEQSTCAALDSQRYGRLTPLILPAVVLGSVWL